MFFLFTSLIFHKYLAIPNDIEEGEKVPALLAVNGHRGSGWQEIFTNISDIYWYGNGFVRRKFVVLAVDVSHRNDSPLYTNYAAGDDRIHCYLILIYNFI